MKLPVCYIKSPLVGCRLGPSLPPSLSSYSESHSSTGTYFWTPPASPAFLHQAVSDMLLNTLPESQLFVLHQRTIYNSWLSPGPKINRETPDSLLQFNFVWFAHFQSFACLVLIPFSFGIKCFLPYFSLSFSLPLLLKIDLWFRFVSS